MLRVKSNQSAVLASAVLALALPADALLYAVLPLNAAMFGISQASVGFLLSINRLVRIAGYPLLASAARRFGMRRFTIAAAIAGALSTLTTATASGVHALGLARTTWGLVYGALLLSSLYYATSSTQQPGARVGWSLSVRSLGPAIALVAGSMLIPLAGVRRTLLLLAVITCAAVPVAALLPAADGPLIRRSPRAVRVTSHDVLSGALGFVVDGIFVLSLGLLFLPRAGAVASTALAGLFLAASRIAAIAVSPFAGHAADRFGAGRMTLIATVAAAAACFLVAWGWIVPGVSLLIAASTVAAATIPIAAISGEDRLASLSRLALSRDSGAGLGALVALHLVEQLGIVRLYVIAGLILALIGGTSASRVLTRPAVSPPRAT